MVVSVYKIIFSIHMKKFFLINAIVSVLLFVITMIVFANGTGYHISESIAAVYMGGSILGAIFSLLGLYTPKEPDPRTELKATRICVLLVSMIVAACIYALLYEWLHLSPLILNVILIVGGIVLLFYVRKTNRRLENLPKKE